VRDYMRAVRKLPSFGLTPFDATDEATREAVRRGVVEDGLLVARRAAPGVFTYYFWTSLRAWQAGVDENFVGDPYVLSLLLLLFVVRCVAAHENQRQFVFAARMPVVRERRSSCRCESARAARRRCCAII
jgi:hypothetical protein